MKNRSFVIASFFLAIMFSSVAWGQDEVPVNPIADTANESFVLYMVNDAKVGDRVGSYEWGRNTYYEVTEREQTSDDVITITLKQSTGGFVLFPHNRLEPLRCGTRHPFCGNAYRITK